MNTILLNVKKIMGVIGAILLVVIIIIPYIILIRYLNKNGKTIQIIPKFKIKSIENKDEVNSSTLSQAISNGQEILQRIRGEK